jgi:hypothetical protein
MIGNYPFNSPGRGQINPSLNHTIMDIEKFVESLTTSEKSKIYYLLQKDIPLKKDIKIIEWLDIPYIYQNISIRVINVLHSVIRQTSENLLLSELTFEMIIKIRGGGNRTWAEFEEFRTQYFSNF